MQELLTKTERLNTFFTILQYLIGLKHAFPVILVRHVNNARSLLIQLIGNRLHKANLDGKVVRITELDRKTLFIGKGQIEFMRNIKVVRFRYAVLFLQNGI